MCKKYRWVIDRYPVSNYKNLYGPMYRRVAARHQKKGLAKGTMYRRVADRHTKQERQRKLCTDGLLLGP